VLDHACGAGLLVRTLRDMGVDAWGRGAVVPPTLAQGFLAEGATGFDVIYAGEGLDFEAEPGAVLSGWMSADPAMLILHGQVLASLSPDGQGLAPELGTRVCAFTPQTLAWLCQRHGRRHVSLLACQVFLRPDIAARLLEPGRGHLLPQYEGLVSQVVNRVWQGLFAQPYHHAHQDQARLKAAAHSTKMV